MLATAEPLAWLIAALAGLAALAIAVRAALQGWHAWLDLRRLEFERRCEERPRPISSAGSRIELADLRERVRKLEAIAAGIDL